MRWFHLGLRVFLVVGVVSGAFVGLVNQSIALGLIAGLIVGLLMVVVTMVLTTMQAGGASGSLSPRQTRTDNIGEPVEVVKTGARDVLAEMRATITAESANRLTARTPVSWRSWGEILTIGFDADGSSTRVRIAIRPRFPLTVADYGHGRELVERVAEHLQAQHRSGTSGA